MTHCEPVHAPCAPSASAAAICCPLPMPPAASTGTGATSLTTCGHNTIEPISPQCPPASPPWAMMMSTPASACLRACDGDPHSAATLRPFVMDVLDHLGGRGAERVRDQCHLRVLQRNLDLRSRGRLGPAEQLQRVVVAVVDRHAVVGEDLARKLQMLLRHERIELLLEHLWRQIGGIHALVLVRNDDVDAIGMVADVLVDPLQLDLELIRRVSDRAQHAEPACLAHGDDDVPAVGERKDRELDVELVADGGVHGCSSVGGVAN